MYSRQSQSKGDTTTRANELYLGLLTIQNAANNEHPEEEAANRGIREKYRLGLFPPTNNGSTGGSTPVPPPANP